MMRHPDREHYELEYFLNTEGDIRFKLNNASGQLALDTVVVGNAGENVFSFRNTNSVISGKQYTIKMITPGNKEYTLLVRLR